MVVFGFKMHNIRLFGTHATSYHPKSSSAFGGEAFLHRTQQIPDPGLGTSINHDSVVYTSFIPASLES